jgi:hypothetical protein
MSATLHPWPHEGAQIVCHRCRLRIRGHYDSRTFHVEFLELDDLEPPTDNTDDPIRWSAELVEQHLPTWSVFSRSKNGRSFRDVTVEVLAELLRARRGTLSRLPERLAARVFVRPLHTSHVAVTLRLSQADWEALDAAGAVWMSDPSVAETLEVLAHHAAEGLRRPGAWEAGWVRRTGLHYRRPQELADDHRRGPVTPAEAQAWASELLRERATQGARTTAERISYALELLVDYRERSDALELLVDAVLEEARRPLPGCVSPRDAEGAARHLEEHRARILVGSPETSEAERLQIRLPGVMAPFLTWRRDATPAPSDELAPDDLVAVIVDGQQRTTQRRPVAADLLAWLQREIAHGRIGHDATITVARAGTLGIEPDEGAELRPAWRFEGPCSPSWRFARLHEGDEIPGELMAFDHGTERAPDWRPPTRSEASAWSTIRQPESLVYLAAMCGTYRHQTELAQLLSDVAERGWCMGTPAALTCALVRVLVDGRGWLLPHRLEHLGADLGGSLEPLEVHAFQVGAVLRELIRSHAAASAALDLALDSGDPAHAKGHFVPKAHHWFTRDEPVDDGTRELTHDALMGWRSHVPALDAGNSPRLLRPNGLTMPGDYAAELEAIGAELPTVPEGLEALAKLADTVAATEHRRELDHLARAPVTPAAFLEILRDRLGVQLEPADVPAALHHVAYVAGFGSDEQASPEVRDIAATALFIKHHDRTTWEVTDGEE